ncbi:hypothetical protein RFI_23309, partial [Reticulomyxa filosa]
WWSRSSSSASLSSFELRRCQSHSEEREDTLKLKRKDGQDYEEDATMQEKQSFGRNNGQKHGHDSTGASKRISFQCGFNSPQFTPVHTRVQSRASSSNNSLPNFNVPKTKKRTKKKKEQIHNNVHAYILNIIIKIGALESNHKSPCSTVSNATESPIHREPEKNHAVEKNKTKKQWLESCYSDDDDNDLSSLDEDPVSCVERQKEMESLMSASPYSLHPSELHFVIYLLSD